MGSLISKQNEPRQEVNNNSRRSSISSSKGKTNPILYLQQTIGNQAIQQLIQNNNMNIPTLQRRQDPGTPVLPAGVTERDADDPLPDPGRPIPDHRTRKEIYVIDFGINKDGMNWREAIRHIGEIEAENVDQMVQDVKAKVGDPTKNCIKKLILDGHGSPGAMSVGDGRGWTDMGRHISTGNYRPSVRSLTPYFCDDATVVLLGCNVGRGSIGERFIQNLAMIWQVKVAAATGVVRGYGIEGIWVWGDPGKQLPSNAVIVAGQIIRILDETTFGDDEEMIFDLLEEAKQYEFIDDVLAELTRKGRWEKLKTDLMDEDTSRYNKLFQDKQ
jgi:hypothetical protein